ncbi:MAG: hypothetical protein E7812_00835 [Phenylobacterium sp.]|nr:MAG: hypothetical protein E7812_00835 [Phenylobacterium sp.]
MEQQESIGRDADVEALRREKRLLALVPGIWTCTNLLDHIAKGESEVIVSCSLGGGQDELIQLLRVSESWHKVLVFENSPAQGWEASGFSERYFPVVADRICWHIDEFNPAKMRSAVISHCEAAKYARFSWQRSAGIPGDSSQGGAHQSAVCGEIIKSEGWLTEAFPDLEFEAYRKKKRALVNAPHSIIALLCCRLLASRDMGGKEQYLAPLQQMLRKEHPEWSTALDYYFRLRAFEVAWEHCEGSQSTDRNERFHSEFLRAYSTASNAQDRFFATNDRLDRIISSNRIEKELSKFREHILQPLDFFNKARATLENVWVYGRPNMVELSALRGFLMETFLEATNWLATKI